MRASSHHSESVLFPSHHSKHAEMLALESTRQQSHPYFPHYSMETSNFFDAAALPLDQLHGYTQHHHHHQQQQHHHYHHEGSPVPQTFYDIQAMYSEPAPEYLPSLSTASGPSVNSASSSAIGSPSSGATHHLPEGWYESHHGLELQTTMDSDFFSNALDIDSGFYAEKLPDSFVDPSVIQPGERQHLFSTSTLGYSERTNYSIPHSAYAPESPIASPEYASENAPLPTHVTEMPLPSQSRPASIHDRRSSISSIQSGISERSSAASSSSSGSGETHEKGPCPDCGRVLKDLKSHRLTHLKERPEKCPISTCAYHVKGFARKYDKNRHTLTHYKGTMVCGFCPGSGSPAEKSFNRADVFKRHLIKIHCVGEAASNSRNGCGSTAAGGKQNAHQDQQQRMSTTAYGGDVTGKCSTCCATFRNAQEFYEHVDECVLRVVQREEPSEAINQLRLAEVAADEDVQKTMERNMLLDTQFNNEDEEDNLDDVEVDSDADVDDDCDEDEEPTYPTSTTTGPRPNRRSGRGSLKSTKDHQSSSSASSRVVLGANSAISKNSRPSTTTTITTTSAPTTSNSNSNNRRRNNRDHYPPSWTSPSSSMKTKKRVLCVFDGPRRLWKDEMMLDNEFEVRVRLPCGAADGTNRDAYITDLDVETIRRAEGVFSASEEERGPWDAAAREDERRCLMGRPAMILGNLNYHGHHGEEEELSLEDLMA